MTYKNMNKKDIVRQLLNVIFSLSQVVFAFIFTLLGIGKGIADQSNTVQTPVIPAGYAFSIWGLIFLLGLVYAYYQALPENRNNELLRKIGWFTAGSFLFNTIWEVVAQLITFNWPTAIIIILDLFCAVGALLVLIKHGKYSKRERWTILIPVSVLAGWISVATFANISSVLSQLNIYFGLSLNSISVLIIILASAFALVVLHKSKGNILYGATILWALVAIFVANFAQTPNPTMATTVAVIIAVFLIDIGFLNKWRVGR